MGSDSTIKVGMADLNIATEGEILKTTGLGSCVGITIYDPKKHFAGMAHIMLPSSSIAREVPINVAKYADTAIPTLIEKLLAKGATMSYLQAKMAGGSQMFSLPGQTDTLRIGPRNVESSIQLLQEFKIPLLSSDTGGNFGRTIEFDSTSGILSIRSVQYGTKEI
jgi:chemotaxis protein CheD